MKTTESGAARLVRTASKAFSRGGDESAGCHGPFMDVIGPFLKDKKLSSLPLLPYRGHRFNILFSNAAAVFFLHREMLLFLKDFHGNRLLQAVLHDMKVPQYMAGVKAFGLVSKFVTEPLWTQIEKKDVHILDMNQRYQQVVTFLKDAALNPRNFMRGEMLLFGEATYIAKGAIFDSLMQDWEHDDLTEVTLTVLLSTIAKVAEHQFKDHIAGGKLDGLESNEEVRRRSLSTPSHNKFAETVFGFFDQLTRTKPAISTIAVEAYTAYSFNKTSQWLHGKSDKELDQLLSSARHSVTAVRVKYKERQQEIEHARRCQTELKLQKERDAAQKKIENLERYTSELVDFGLWQTQEQVDICLEKFETDSLKKKAIKVQLNFRQHFFRQKGENRSVFNFTKVVAGKRMNLTPEELANNLKSLISDSYLQDAGGDATLSQLVGKRVVHWFEELKEGVKHRMSYKGKVLSQVPGYPTWFNLKYDNDPAIYTYQLLEDQKSGDLQIVVS